MKLKQEEALQFKNALINLKEDPNWKKYIEFEELFLQNRILMASEGLITDNAYAVIKAYHQGMVESIKTLRNERDKLFKLYEKEI